MRATPGVPLAEQESQESYVYDPLGDRVAKLVAGDVATDTEFLYDPDHRLMTTVNSSYTLQDGNVYLGNRLLGDYTAGAANFYLRMTDQVGSLRGLWGYGGAGISSCISTLPFGDGLTCQNSGGDTDQPFTGKERDAESGLDYFGARYYASSMGRFMSPDWADKPEAVPYSQLDNPQSLNLYGYVNNNPLSKADPDGHAPDILVIEDGPTQGNPIGHTAIAVTGRGVYSFGTNTPLGSSTTDFLQMESGRRNQTVTVIKTTPEQDQAAVNELTKQNGNGSINLYPDNCASRTNAALDAAGVPQKTYSTPVAEVPAQDTSMPGTAGSRAQATPGSQTTVIPQGGAVPSNLNQFNPKPNQPPPPVEKKTPNTAGSSS